MNIGETPAIRRLHRPCRTATGRSDFAEDTVAHVDSPCRFAFSTKPGQALTTCQFIQHIGRLQSLVRQQHQGYETTNRQTS